MFFLIGDIVGGGIVGDIVGNLFGGLVGIFTYAICLSWFVKGLVTLFNNSTNSNDMIHS